VKTRQQGIAALEFVLCLPILIVCLITIVYYGEAFAIYRTGVDAAYAGAQAALIRPPLARNAAGGPASASVGAGTARDAAAQVVAGYGIADEGADDGVCLSPAADLVSTGANDYRYVVTIDFAACRVMRGLSVDLPLLGRLPPLPGNVAVSASVTL
jgi:Flp pilus assembly protein TadG